MAIVNVAVVTYWVLGVVLVLVLLTWIATFEDECPCRSSVSRLARCWFHIHYQIGALTARNSSIYLVRQ
jgi:hypothetical protein